MGSGRSPSAIECPLEVHHRPQVAYGRGRLEPRVGLVRGTYGPARSGLGGYPGDLAVVDGFRVAAFARHCVQAVAQLDDVRRVQPQMLVCLNGVAVFVLSGYHDGLRVAVRVTGSINVDISITHRRCVNTFVVRHSRGGGLNRIPARCHFIFVIRVRQVDEASGW